MADFKLITYISNCLLLSVTLNIYKITIFDIMFMLNLTYFLLNIFLFKMPIWATGGFYTNTVFYSYTDYIVNDETYSLDKLLTMATGWEF